MPPDVTPSDENPGGDDTGGDGDDGLFPPEDEEVKKYRVRGEDVSIISERVQYYDVGGKLITESLIDYTKKNILGEYATLDSFINQWNKEERKQAIIDELREQGIFLDVLKEESGLKDVDDFDLICHIAYDKKPLTRAERAQNVKKKDYLSKYSDAAKRVLEALLDKYMENGISDIENLEVLRTEPFRSYGSPMKIAKLFGGKKQYLNAVIELQNYIYEIA